MSTNDNPSWLSRFITSHFNKRVFPYWCVVLADTAIVFVSTAFVYWAFHRTGVLFEHRYSLLYLMLLYSALNWIGARAFRTYSGVVLGPELDRRTGVPDVFRGGAVFRVRGPA